MEMQDMVRGHAERAAHLLATHAGVLAGSVLPPLMRALAAPAHQHHARL